MKQKKLTFQQVVARLEKANIPCTVKRYGYDDEITYSIEFGFNWPEELVEQVDKAFEWYGEKVPDYVGLCGSSFRDNMTAKKTIAGGPRTDYNGWNKW
jgi:hypothetical protein